MPFDVHDIYIMEIKFNVDINNDELLETIWEPLNFFWDQKQGSCNKYKDFWGKTGPLSSHCEENLF